MEEENTPPQRTEEEPSGPTDEHRPVEEQSRSILAVTPAATPLSQTTPPIRQPVDDVACLLCDELIDVCVEPCGHTVLCRSHANTAKRCPQCRVCVDL